MTLDIKAFLHLELHVEEEEILTVTTLFWFNRSAFGVAAAMDPKNTVHATRYGSVSEKMTHRYIYKKVIKIIHV